MNFKKQTIYTAVLSILILMLPSASDHVTCLKRNEAICCPTKCSEKCHSNNTFERATCRSYSGTQMQCIEKQKIDLHHCLNNISHTNKQCIISKAYTVTCNNATLNKQGLWKAPEFQFPFPFSYAKCNSKKENEVECKDFGGKPLQCANPDCGFNSPLGENDICNITPAYDVKCINNKQNTSHYREKNWKAPPDLTFVNARCQMKDDKLECRDFGGTSINCEEHQKCGFNRTFKKDDICYIAQAHNVDCMDENKRPTCCQQTCNWKTPKFKFNNLSCQRKDKKLECREAKNNIKCENDQNCGFDKYLGRDEICFINQSNQDKGEKGLEKEDCNDGCKEEHTGNDTKKWIIGGVVLLVSLVSLVVYRRRKKNKANQEIL
ncbi:hypothetical protein QQF64_008902 [Cirrhinus molitorella]|uniref:Uncharacterized protein n=1 Tax=Cirrhinus molitorella TaxID=172907 RepID=A0ABR3M899_9TELE